VTADGRTSPFLQVTLLGEACRNVQDGAVFVWDEDRNYVAVNEGASRLTGLTCEELLEMHVGDLSPERASPHFEDVQRHPRTTGRSTIQRRDGTQVEIEWVTFRTRVADLPYMVSVCWPAA
jgi:PAS domain S-box-containing protein